MNMKFKQIALSLAAVAALGMGWGNAAAVVTVKPVAEASTSVATSVQVAEADESGISNDGIGRCLKKKTQHGFRDCICKFVPDSKICKPSKS